MAHRDGREAGAVGGPQLPQPDNLAREATWRMESDPSRRLRAAHGLTALGTNAAAMIQSFGGKEEQCGLSLQSC